MSYILFWKPLASEIGFYFIHVQLNTVLKLQKYIIFRHKPKPLTCIQRPFCNGDSCNSICKQRGEVTASSLRRGVGLLPVEVGSYN